MGTVTRIKGRWAKGQSANPGGRAALTAAEREARQLLKEATPEAARRLVSMLASADERVALAACQAILSRLPLDEADAALDDGDAPLAAQLRRLAERVEGRAGAGET